jgi:hypothetical protein
MTVSGSHRRGMADALMLQLIEIIEIKQKLAALENRKLQLY